MMPDTFAEGWSYFWRAFTFGGATFLGFAAAYVVLDLIANVVVRAIARVVVGMLTGRRSPREDD